MKNNTQTLDEKIGKKLNDIAFFSAWATSDIEYIKQAIKQSLLANMPEKKSVGDLFPDYKHEPTPEFAMQVQAKEYYNKSIDDCIRAIEEVLG